MTPRRRKTCRRRWSVGTPGPGYSRVGDTSGEGSPRTRNRRRYVLVRMVILRQGIDKESGPLPPEATGQRTLVWEPAAVGVVMLSSAGKAWPSTRKRIGYDYWNAPPEIIKKVKHEPIYLVVCVGRMMRTIGGVKTSRWGRCYDKDRHRPKTNGQDIR